MENFRRIAEHHQFFAHSELHQKVLRPQLLTSGADISNSVETFAISDGENLYGRNIFASKSLGAEIASEKKFGLYWKISGGFKAL